MRLFKILLAVFALSSASICLAPQQAHAQAGVTQLSCTPPAADPEIASLARALNYNIAQIYEYVYYDIDYSPTFGSKKGALGTFLDRRGNNIDQNVLFVTLLRQSCITANYRYGTIGLPSASLANQLGVANDAAVLSGVLGNGGIPACVQATSGGACITSGTPTNVNVNLVWTEATVGGTVYELDPSFKSYTSPQAIDIAAATGYSQSDFLNSALSTAAPRNGVSAGVQSLVGLDQNTLNSKLNTYAQNLANYIQTNYPSYSVKQLFGGRDITNSFYGSTFPAAGTLYTTLPASLETVYSVTVSNASDGSNPTISLTLYGDQIQGRRLSLTYNSSNQPVLALEGTVLATGAAATGAKQTISMTVTNPYAAGSYFGSYTIRPSVWVGGGYAVMLQAGEIGRDTLTRHQRVTAKLLEGGTSTYSSEPVTGEALAAIGSSYLAQASRANLTLANYFGFTFVAHEWMGVVGKTTSVWIDFPGQINSSTIVGSNTDLIGAMSASTIFDSMLEATTINQMQNTSAASTVPMFEAANRDGGILLATASNWSSANASLLNYNCNEQSNIQAFLAANPGSQVVMTTADVGVNGWGGCAYYKIYSQSLSNGSIFYYDGAILAGQPGTYKGSAATTNISAPAFGPLPSMAFGNNAPSSSATAPGYDPIGASASGLPTMAQSQNQLPPVFSPEPINMLTGSYYYEHEDIAVGSGNFPFNLALKRSYDSDNRVIETALGYGWRHNFMMSASIDNNSFEAFGDHNPMSVVPTMVALYVMKDVSKGNSVVLGNRYVASLTASWLMKQLINNVVSVSLDSGVKQFARIPTASGQSIYVPPPGDGSTLVVNSNNSIVLADKNRAVINFDTDGKIASWADSNQNTVSFTYNGSGPAKTLASVSNGLGRTLSFTYNSTNLLTSVGDGTRTVSYTYDSTGNLLTYTDANTQQTKFAYQSGTPGFLTQIFYPNNPNTAFMTNTYDSFGRVTTQADAFRNVWYYMFANGKRAQEVDPLGDTHTYYYDRNGNLVRDINQNGDTTTIAYDGVGRLSTTTYPEGDSVALTYDGKSNVLTKTTNPIPGGTDVYGNANVPAVNTFTYDPTFNHVLTAKDANGNATTNTYDSVGNLLTVTQPAVAKAGVSGTASPVTKYTYGTHGLIATATDAEGRVTATTYDPTTFNLTKVVQDSGSGHLNLTTSYAYDATGNNNSVTDPNGNVATVTYDNMRRATQLTAPTSTGAITKNAYDATGNLISVQKATGNSSTPWETTTTAYNAAQKPTVVTAPDGTTATTGYDTAGRAITVTSSSGRQVLTTYDPAGHVTKITDQVSGSLDPSISSNLGAVVRETRTYYPGDLLATLADGKGNTLTYSYDGFKHAKVLIYPDSTSSAPDQEFFGHDANGNTTLFQRRGGAQISYGYDALNRLTSKSPANENAYQYYYDYTGLTSQICNGPTSSPCSSGIAYQYDTAGRNTGEYSTAFGFWTPATVDANGNRTTISLAGINYTPAFSFDALNRLTSVNNGSARVVSFGYDPLSRRISASYGSASAPVASSVLAYTSADQIASLTHTWSGSSLTETYIYNNDHQRSGLSVSDNTYLLSGQAAASATYASNTLNQYSSVTKSAATAYAYDARGNLTSDGTWTYTYDTENHLITAVSSGASVSYAYDALGRRLNKAVTASGTTTYTYYLSLGNQEIAEYQGTSTVNFTRSFIYGAGLDEPIVSIDASGNLTYQFADASISVIALANANGQVTEKYAYAAYGNANVTATTQGGTAAYRYAGRRFDPETGLYYNRARMYSASLGRFLQTDPIGTDGGINIYAYTGDDPINAVDPMGKDCSTSNGFISCSSSNYKFTVPVAKSPLAWPFNGTDAANFTSTDPGYHTYSTPANGGNAINGSTANAYNYVVNNPVPGTHNPATPAGTANDATPFIGNNYAVISPVMSYTTTNELNGQPIMVNVTLPGHILSPGIVVREVDTDANGGTIINNWGEGTGALQNPNSPTGFASGAINGVWNGLYPHK